MSLAQGATMAGGSLPDVDLPVGTPRASAHYVPTRQSSVEEDPTVTPGTTQTPAARMESGFKLYGSGDAEVRALDGVDVTFAAGAFTAIMGPSGSGKSTLMQCMAGLDRLTSGQTWIGDVELTGLSEKEITRIRRDRVGFIFQAFNLVPTLNALENVRLPLDIAGREPEGDWMDQVVDALNLRERLPHRPSELSGGQQQRVAAARALVSRPDIVFADEPTGQLDSQSSAELLDFMRRAADEFGLPFLMVTPEPSAASRADLILFLADGRIVDQMDDPTPESILHRMKTLGA
jgi:putative ABC transport system ATP-binding protein